MVFNYQTMVLMKHTILESKLLLSSHMKGKNLIYWIYCIHITNVFASTFQIASTPNSPSPPLQLLNLQECAEVIYLKWPLLFLILIWFQKSQIIETILNIYFVHLLCCIMIPCDFHLRHISWHAFDTPCCFAQQKIQDARNQCHP